MQKKRLSITGLLFFFFLCFSFTCCKDDKIPQEEPGNGQKPEEIPVLITTNASPEAVKVYHFLHENFGKKIISGTMANVSWNINEAQWVYMHTGVYPALNCFDYVHLHNSPSSWINYNSTAVVQNWWKANGLVAVMWHWNVPVRAGSSTYDFYTKNNTFDINKALQAGTYENKIVMADLQKTADYLFLLKQRNIPVIWRPLHEASGRWFWWGAKGAEPYKGLWKLMFETFEAKGLNNLIWVWTSEVNDAAWYPGDGYVDIIGRDLYNRQVATQVNNDYQKLKTDYPAKLIALSEFGNVAPISDQWAAGATWSWFMSWYDYNRTNAIGSVAFNETTHAHANIAYWKSAFADSLVISRDKMPSLK